MQCWYAHIDGGPRRVNHGAVAVGNLVFTFGGYCTGEDYETTRPMDVHVLDTVWLRWRVVDVADPNDDQFLLSPYQRYGHTAVGLDEFIYIWGGRNDRNGACNLLYKFDTNTLKWSQPKVKGDIPGARDGHSACVIHRRMYIFGGYEEFKEQFSQEVHYLDLDNLTWTWCNVKGQLIRWRDFHTATAFGDYMLVFGGRGDLAGPIHTNNEVYCNKIQHFDVKTNTWYEPVVSGSVPVGRRSHSAFVYGKHLYIFGGYNGLEDRHYDDLYQFDPVKMIWSKFKVQGRGPCKRRRQCCCVVDHRMFLFGGTSPSESQSHPLDYELLDLSDLHVLDFAPSLKSLCQMSLIKMKLDWSCLPRDLRLELKSLTTNNKISRPLTSG